MTPTTAARRADDLRKSVADGRQKLAEAIEALGRVSTERLTLGGRMTNSPWHWLLGAGACGLLLGLLHHPTD